MPTSTVPQAFALALQHHRAGRLAEAEALYRQILGVEPSHAEARHFLGVVAHQGGRHDLAIDLIRQAIGLNPNNSTAYSNLGGAYRAAGRLEEAVASIRRALQLQPNNPEAENNLGNALREQGQLDEAIAAYRRALEFKPDYAKGYYNLGVALGEQGQRDEAVAAFQRAIQLKPNYPEAYNNLGGALAVHGKWDEAIAAYRRVLEFQPGEVEAHNNLGSALVSRGQLDEAIVSFRRAIELKPDHPEAIYNLGTALKEQGEVGEAAAAYRRALELEPDRPLVRSKLIYVLQFDPDEGERLAAEECQHWNRQFCEPLKRLILPHANDRSPERRLRVGYVSPDFRFHAVSFFVTPLLEAHDHSAFEIYCYANSRESDAVTKRLRRSADVWRQVDTYTDAQLAECVRNDGIDILVDLAMHTPDNRLAVFARKPAPVQVSWLAYPGSTGMEAIDYRLTDGHIEPADEENDGRGGKAVRLPDAWCCYAPIEEFPLVGPLPAASEKGVTFGSFHQFRKIHEGLLHCWARLLEAVPKSRLLMVCPEGRVRERTRAVFATHGVARDRVELVSPCPWADYIRLVERIDITLDSYPCNGMTTTCHALWMGVPVVTLAGRRAVSRAGRSLLHTIGLPEWVAQNEEEYTRIAAEWASDLPRLAELRAKLRPLMQASPLMDAPRFARNVEAAYRTMWQAWSTNPSGHV